MDADVTGSMSLGELLRAYRRAAELTQETVAERAGISVRVVSNTERDAGRVPRKNTLALLNDALELPPEDRARVEAAWRRRAEAQDAQPGMEPALPPLVGRERELALLDRHLTGAGPPVLMFAGEPGIGKSRLLDEAAARAPMHGLRVLHGGCQRHDAEAPYAPLPDALTRYINGLSPARRRADLRGCAWLARLLPELADALPEPPSAWPLPPGEERRLMSEALARFLGNVAGPAGTLLALDDLQWAAADALALLARLVRPARAPAVPLYVVGAYRDTEARPGDPLAEALADLAHQRLVAHHTLTPLSTPEAAQLLDGLLTGAHGEGVVVDPVTRERVARRTGGVPFFVVSYAQALRADTHAEDNADAVPWDVRQSLRQRVAALPRPAQTMLGAAAVVGRRVSRALLVSALERPEDEVLDALEDAARARLLVEAGPDTYQFAYDVIREVIESGLGAGRRTVLHRRVAEALERARGERSAEALAYHYGRGDAPEKAVLYLELAGDRALGRYATEAAEAYYRETAQRLDWLERPRDAARVREKLGEVLRTVNKFDDALTVLDAALEVYRAAGDQLGLGRVTAQIGHVHLDRGTPDQAMARVLDMLTYLEDNEAWQGLAALYMTLALFFVAGGRYQEQMFAAERAIELAHKAGDAGIAANAEAARGHALLLLGRLDEARAVMEAAIPLAEAVGDLDCLTATFGNLSALHRWRGDVAQSWRYVERSIAAAEQLGNAVLIMIAKFRRAVLALYAGDMAQAHADLDWVAPLDERIGGAWVFAYPVIALGVACAIEGDWERAERYLERGSAVAAPLGDIEASRRAQTWLAERDLSEGRPAAARDRLIPLLDREGLQELDVTTLLPLLVRAYLGLGDADRGAEMATESVSRARAQGHRIALADALWARGMVAARQEQWDEAAQALEEGLDLTHDISYPYAEARTLETYGAMRLAQGEIGAARTRLEAALAIFDRLGARGDAARVEQAIADLSRD